MHALTCRFIFLSVNLAMLLSPGLLPPHPDRCRSRAEDMAWMHDKGFVWNPSTVTLCGGTDGEVGFAVAAAREIAEHDTLCEIPKDAVLSVRNSAIANLIEQEQLGGGLGLILSIMYEVSIGVRSKW